MIFSRKGFDSGSGGTPSPILPERAVSLPIPTRHRSRTTYAELGLAELVADLTRGRIAGDHLCHFDPDLQAGALGQVGSAQGHLARQNVEPGDVFLFFGLFRPAERTNGVYRFRSGSRAQHRLFGWLQIGEIVHLGEDGTQTAHRLPHLNGHPHLGPGWNRNNTLYVAAERLRLASRSPRLSGFGQFTTVDDRLRLSADPAARPSLWRAPAWLNPLKGGVGLSYHSASERWTDGTLQLVGRGQEFVADIGDRADARSWLEEIVAVGTG